MLLVDVSSIIRFDPQTGIQRVVRRLLQEMMGWASAPFRIEPVYEYRGEYYFARRFTHGLLGLPLSSLDRASRPDSLARPAPGDLFLGLDWSPPMIRSASATLARWRQQGVSLHFVVYDLLPIQLPQYFPRQFSQEMNDWILRIAALADSLQCISSSVAQELEDYLQDVSGAGRAPAIESFPLGADFQLSEASEPEGEGATQEGDSGIVTCLMVGTLDPRKGYAQALSAFERLWQNQVPVRLVIIGRPGAMNARLSLRLRHHPEVRRKSPKLIWLESASDEVLNSHYRNADFLLAASEGEGFGLPLLEAAAHDLPVLARGIPVFREVLGDQATYFDGLEPSALAEAIGRFVETFKAGGVSTPDLPDVCSWRESAQSLAGNLMSFTDAGGEN